MADEATRPPFQLLRLDHLVLRTRNVERLVEFYERLGCRPVRRVESVNLTQLAAGESMIDILGVSDRREVDRNLDHFALRIEPFDVVAIEAFCHARGIPLHKVEGRLLGADGFGPAVYIEDPDGNRVELKGPPQAPRP